MSSNEQFATRLNSVLDQNNFPRNETEREHTFGEYFDIPQQKAKMILSGGVIPKKSILEKIADELFIDTEELLA